MIEIIDDARETYTVEVMEAAPQSDVNISDVIEVIETDGMYTADGAGDARRPRAYVKITEQPASKALRFRYECEGRSAGSIPGVSSTPENKTFPTIQIVGYTGRAVVVVSCVTKDSPYRPHPHNLVGKEGCSRGVCTLKMNSDTISFSNLGIQCVKKKDIEEALKVREEIRVDPFRTGFSHRVQPSNIDLNSVRLCFQVFLEGPKKDEFTIPLRPAVSEPIYDKKAMSDLTICKLSDCSATVAGGREIILLCEKVAKEDIQIRFYEEQEGETVWEAQGDFQPTHVHKQVAIAFRTPKYRDLDVDKPVKVWVQLRRPSDGATSEAIPFLMTPLDAGRPGFWTLRRALSKKGDYGTFSDILTVEAQKRKLEALAPCETKKQKDSLISGGPLVTLPLPPITVYEEEPKELRLELAKPELQLLETTKTPSPKPEHEAMLLDDKSKFDDSFDSNKEEIDSLEMLLDGNKESSFEALLDKTKENSIDGLLDKSKDENSFDDLITQVAEMDEIYSEARGRLHLGEVAINCSELFDDSQTYTSLQLAMKNPIEVASSYEDVTPVQSPIIDLNPPVTADDKLPPLPPKRVKQNPPGRPETSPPVKELPKTPDSTKSKSTIFNKLFSKKKPEKQLKRHSSSTESLRASKSSLDDVSPKANEKGFARWFNRGSTGNLAEAPVPEPEKNVEQDMDLDLTEAENYALYTANAPHATASEFDEISSYYSPVEGDTVFIKRKRHKIGGETSPQNMLRPSYDEDSRSTYVGSVSPDHMQMLQVKREPLEASPSRGYGGNLSPMYPGTSPGPASPHNAPSPVQFTTYTPYINQINVRLPAGGGLVDLNPAAQTIFSEQPVLNNLNNPGAFSTQTVATPVFVGKHVTKLDGERNTVLDMDSQQYSLELNLGNLDSGELARMAMFTDANLSENLSSNLTLSERLDGDRPQDHAMTDSFTRAANNAIQELVSLGSSMYPPQPQ